MTSEDKRNALLRLGREGFGEGNLETIDELTAPDLVDHDPLPGSSPDRDGFKAAVRLMRAAFPDLAVEILHALVEDDKVVLHTAFRGTHSGEFLGIPATGKPISTAAIDIGRLGPDGRVAERWQRFGALQLMQQIGVVPGWEEPPPVAPLPEVEGDRTATREEATELVVRQLAVWNDGDEAVADELFHPASITPDAPQLPPGPEGCKVVARMFRSAFPDFHMTVEDTVAEGDFVACRFRQTGTHEGDFLGIPPTGRRVDYGEIALCQVG